jgi:alkylhydroperoxidase family enzyme
MAATMNEATAVAAALMYAWTSTLMSHGPNAASSRTAVAIRVSQIAGSRASLNDMLPPRR